MNRTKPWTELRGFFVCGNGQACPPFTAYQSSTPSSTSSLA